MPRPALALIYLLTAAASWSAPRLTLQEAQNLAIQQHPRLSAARSQAEAAMETPHQVHARLRPQMIAATTGALAEDTNTRVLAGGLNNPIVLNRWGAGVGISQLLTDFGRTKNLEDSAQKKAQAAGEGVRVTRAGVLLRVTQAYYAVLSAQAVRKVAAETVAARQLVADRAAALAANKLRSELDVNFARVDLQEARLLENNALNAEKAAAMDLANALGLETPMDFELVDEPGTPDAPRDWDLEAKSAAANRPEISQARFDQEAAAAFVKAEKALRFPTIQGVVTTGVAPFHVERVQGHWNAGGITVDLPFLNGGLFASRRREAEARERAAGQTARDVANQIARDVRVAYFNSVNAHERLRLTAELVSQARQSFDLSKARYDLGLSSIVEVSQAQLGLTRAEIATATARFEYLSSLAVLKYQNGTL